MTHPDDDLTAKKLELALAESNLAVHESQLEQAGRELQTAAHYTEALPDPEDKVARVLVAQALGSIAAARASRASLALALEHERAGIEHARAHIDHAEEEAAHRDEARGKVQGAFAQLKETLERQGIHIEDGPIPGSFGISFGETEE